MMTRCGQNNNYVNYNNNNNYNEYVIFNINIEKYDAGRITVVFCNLQTQRYKNNCHFKMLKKVTKIPNNKWTNTFMNSLVETSFRVKLPRAK